MNEGDPRHEPDMDVPLRIVVIGASAGGLEPMEKVFADLPAETGCAFVVVQHLSPDFRSMMDALLARRTTMRIRQLEEGMILEPDCVHLNLPRTLVTLRDGRVHLGKGEDPVSVGRPIDALLDSLAEGPAGHVLAVLLSGTGSDGRRGGERVRARGARVIVQLPEEARFDGMPRAAIEAGLADAITPAAGIAGQIVRWIDGDTLQDGENGEDGETPGRDPVGDILALLRHRYGTDFVHYKDTTVMRRIGRRADLRGLDDLVRYESLLHRDTDELDELYGDLLIEVTAFFRDAEAFECVAREAVPALVERLAAGHSLRLWVAGCASGEEAYSLAILLAEHAAAAGVELDAKIIATDVHGRSLERAAAGNYPLSSVSHLDESRVDAWFTREGNRVRVRDTLRRQVMFSTHDVVSDAPFTRIDFLSCRNLLIYLVPEAQGHVLSRFHFGLAEGGWLFLGPSENVAGLEHAFEVRDRQWRLYRRREVALPVRSSMPASVRPPHGSPGDGTGDGSGGNVGGVDGASGVDFASSPRAFARLAACGEGTPAFRRAHAAALERIVAEHAPPGFLLTLEGDIVHIFGDAGALLPMRQGVFSARVTELIEPGLRTTLFAALQIAARDDFAGFSRRVRPLDGDTAYDIALSHAGTDGKESDFLLLTIATVARREETDRSPDGSDEVHADADDVRTLARRVRELEADLRVSEHSLQSTIEELQSTNEELQSTNEEMTASNEELQSTNEELHSVNEELYTVSAEHQRKIEELSALTADVDHLLVSSEIGMIFLDRALRLRRCSDRAEELFGFGPRDVGREIDKVGGRMPNAVAALPRRVLETREPIETDVVLGERLHLLKVLPHIDADGAIDGVLMSSVDITELSETRRELGRIDEEYRTIVEDTSSFIVRWRADDGRITYCNGIYAEFFDETPETLVGRAFEALIPEPEREAFLEQIATIEPGESRFLAIVRDDPDGSATYTVGFTRAIADEDGAVVEYQSTGQDLSEEYAYRRALERLVATTRNAALDHAERLQRILGLCLGYLGLRSGFVSRIDGEDYHVIAVAGEAAERYAAGDVLALEETVCANLPEEGGLLAIRHLADSELRDHPCHAATGIESVVAARLATAEGSYGSIAFSSPEPRDRPFTLAEESFVMLVSSWIGYMIDSRRRLERVALSNDYYQSLYLGLPVVMCLTDPEGIVVEVSDEWLEHFGRRREGTLGAPFVDFLSDGEHRVIAAEAIRVGSIDDLSLCLHRADGKVVEHEMSCRTRAIGTLEDMRLIVLADVSERARAMEETESRNRELADVNENLNQFAFVASHDLQEPLRKIQQFSGFLVEDERDTLSEDGRYHLKVIVEAAERMSRLIRDLLQYSRASRNTLGQERVSLDAVLAQVRVDLEIPLAESRAVLHTDPLPVVTGDPVLLLQLFTNLVANAVKYHEPSRTLEIEVRHENGEPVEASRIEIIDNGIGFDPAYATKVFEPFLRLHGSKDYPGSGIGLAICATVCRKHGWRIEADGRPGQGSRFSIVLDAARPSPEDGRADEESAA